MPIYLYGCECGERVEHMRSISSRLNHVICKCGKEMELIIRSPAIKVTLAMKERLNQNWEKREIKRKKGELLT